MTLPLNEPRRPPAAPARLARRACLRRLAGCLAAVPLSRCLFAEESMPTANEELPPSGDAHPDLAPFDALLAAFVAERQAPGAALAVTRGGRLVYARGFGHADRQRGLPVQPDSLFRIASVSKPLTAVAVMQLVEAGKLRLEDKAFGLVNLAAHLEPGGAADPRLAEITIGHLLQHTAGWDREQSFDPIARPWQIAEALGISPPVTPCDVVRYCMGRPLDFDPGTRFAYCNVGYLVLGRAIEAATGLAYEEYVRRCVLAPLGVTRMQLGRACLEHRAPGEVCYYDRQQRTGPAVAPPEIGRTVPLPDGAENLEGYEAHGGWIASAIDLVRFASAFDNPAASPLLRQETIRTMFARPPGPAGHEADGRPKEAYYACGWNVRPVGTEGAFNAWHMGRIAGTSTLLVRRHDGLNWAALFNTDVDPAGNPLAAQLDPLLHQAADRVARWPEIDLFERYLGQ